MNARKSIEYTDADAPRASITHKSIRYTPDHPLQRSGCSYLGVVSAKNLAHHGFEHLLVTVVVYAVVERDIHLQYTTYLGH